MSNFPERSQEAAGLPLVSKCRSKSGSQSSGNGACGCQGSSGPMASTREAPRLPEAAPVQERALLASAEPIAHGGTAPATAPLASACGCGHHAVESASASSVEAAGSCKCQKLRWIRKTHAALGVIFGLFLVEHFTATALGLRPALFERHMQGVHATLNYLPWLEVLIFVPLIALLPFGIYLLYKSGLRYNVKKCNRGGKVRFFLQRVSAVVILGFLAFHLLSLRDWGPRLGSAPPTRSGNLPASFENAAPSAYATSVWQIWDFLPSANAAAPLRLAVTVLYLLGMTAVIYHLANGLWTGAIAWGLTQSEIVQKRSLVAFAAFGIVLLMLGALGWYAFIVAPWSGAVG